MRAYLKNTQHKKEAGGEAQMVERLPSKHDALSSNTCTKKKKIYIYIYIYIYISW
jgi:hypothetical protein